MHTRFLILLATHARQPTTRCVLLCVSSHVSGQLARTWVAYVPRMETQKITDADEEDRVSNSWAYGRDQQT